MNKTYKCTNNKKCCIHSKKYRLLIVSIFLLTSGTILILGNMGIIDRYIFRYIFSWQSLLIAFGIFNLAGGIRSHWFGSTILISVGTLFLIDELYTLRTGFSNIIWPLLLIIVGIAIIVKIFFSKKNINSSDNHFNTGEEKSNFGIGEQKSDDDYINVSRIFSGIRIRSVSQNFHGGNGSFIFGGGEIDLREAKLSEGITVLKVECIFGGVKIYVPINWDVSIESTGIFGGFSDERRYISINDIDKTRKLIIKAEAVFGGGEISN